MCLALPILVAAWTFKGAAAAFAQLDPSCLPYPMGTLTQFPGHSGVLQVTVKNEPRVWFLLSSFSKGSLWFLITTSVYSGFSQSPEIWLNPLNFQFLSTLTDLFSCVKKILVTGRLCPSSWQDLCKLLSQQHRDHIWQYYTWFLMLAKLVGVLRDGDQSNLWGKSRLPHQQQWWGRKEKS